MKEKNSPLFLSLKKQICLVVLSFLIVSFGQPAWNSWLGIVAAACGHAIFWRTLFSLSQQRQRFALATTWFFAVQLVQLSWLISHPYLYIYILYFGLSFALGIQYGFLALLIQNVREKKIWPLLGIASVWTLLEWMRLSFLSGFSWNPAGLALSGNLYSLQMASLWGVYGLSFWVIFVNLLALKAWLNRFSLFSTSVWITAALLPYLYGIFQLAFHTSLFEENQKKNDGIFNVVLVQTAFPVEETMGIKIKNMVAYVIDEWEQILKITKKHENKEIDLIALPEFVVSFGTYSFVYPYETVKDRFQKIYGPRSLSALPPLEYPYAERFKTPNGEAWMVNNAFWAQGIANYFASPLIAGLEDAEDILNQREYYSAALYFKPHPQEALIERYEKRVLVPMGEYIPFEYFRDLAASYGIAGSFTCGKKAKVMSAKKLSFGVSICYEETFGDLVRENKLEGAQMLVNLTSDVWFPDSRLPSQHFEHARLRTIENGFPLIRACNTGITGACDSFGRTVGVLGGDNPQKVEWIPDALYVQVPTYSYTTLYTLMGDRLILSISLICSLIFALAAFFVKTPPAS